MTEEQKPNKKRIWTTLIIIAFAIGGYFVIQYRMDANENNYYAHYTNVKGLQASSPVELKGVRVGKISEIELTDKAWVKVTITTKSDIEIPNGTVALLVSGGLMGDKSIRLVPGTGPGIIPDNAEIPTAFDTSVMPSSVQVTPYLETMKSFLKSTDSTLDALNIFVQTGLARKTTYALISAEEKTRAYAKMANNLNTKTDGIVTSIQKAENTVSKTSGADINGTIQSANSKITELAKKDIRQNVNSIRSSIQSMKVMAKEANSDTGIGKLVNYDSTYKNVANRFSGTNSKMKELQAHPPGFSIIGGKKKKK